MNFPIIRQSESRDCAATCLQMVAKYYNKNISIVKIRKLSETTRQGTSLNHVANASEKIGFRSLGVKISIDKLKEISLPCILHWNQSHFVVLYEVKNEKYYIADPAHGKIVLKKALIIYPLEIDMLQKQPTTKSTRPS